MRSPFCIAFLCLLVLPASVAHSQDTRRSPEDRKQALLDSMWWNQAPKIEALELDDELRLRMNAQVETFLEVQEETTDEKRFERFGDAMEAGDLRGAEEIAEEISSAHARTMRAQMQLIVDVASLLSDEQRSLVTEKYPRIFRRPWVRDLRQGGRGERARSRTGG